MPAIEKAKVFKNGRSQAVRIPAKYRFTTNEVSIRQDEATGDLILSQHEPRKQSWKEFFAEFDSVSFPEDFMDDREQGEQSVREEL